ncbi:heparin lyase I family protein [Inquilinus sp. CA228]|uniref:heparin lyase I family protein n=1 Tax=Inquilinus sp. CA228 TaxID=3455609 RepID=UPI003F8D8035
MAASAILPRPDTPGTIMLPAPLRRLLLPAILILTTAPAAAAEISDGFESGRIDPQVWAPCPRTENRFFIEETVVRSGRYAAGMALLPDATMPPAIPPAEVQRRRSGCLDTAPGAMFAPEDDQRAELWLQSTEPPGTDSWFGFSFRIDSPDAGAGGNRLVVGQWKQSGSQSPILAQRFKGGAFHLTVEQATASPGRQCRVLIAWQDGYDFSDFSAGTRSFLHGGGDELESPPPAPAAECARGLAIDRTAPLPSPFGAWVDMVVHLRVAGRPDDLIEVWADGRPVVTVRGPVGSPAGRDQYFKFGPYRDPSPAPLVVRFDDFSRGGSFAAVDPRRFDR